MKLRIGSLNVRGCGVNEVKQGMIGKMFEERRLDVLALSETKLRGKGEVTFGKVLGRRSGIVRGRARAGVALIVKEELQQYVVEW